MEGLVLRASGYFMLYLDRDYTDCIAASASLYVRLDSYICHGKTLHRCETTAVGWISETAALISASYFWNRIMTSG